MRRRYLLNISITVKLSVIPVEKLESCEMSFSLFSFYIFFIHNFYESNSINYNCHFITVSNVDACIELGMAARRSFRSYPVEISSAH